jgi:hypothetical protein
MTDIEGQANTFYRIRSFNQVHYYRDFLEKLAGGYHIDNNRS